MLHRCPWCQRLEPTWEAVTQELHVKYPESDGRLRFAKARSQTECACVDLFGQSARVKRSSRCSVCNPGYLEVSACFAGSPVKPSVLNSRHQAWSPSHSVAALHKAACKTRRIGNTWSLWVAGM